MPNDTEFEREKLCFVQNSEHARGLNTQMNAIPAFAVTLTGGLWYGAGVTAGLDPKIRFALLVFVGLADLVLILAALRVRDVLQSHLEKMQTFYPEGFAGNHPVKPMVPAFGSYSMISMYSLLMGTASLLSFVGAFCFYWPWGLHYRPAVAAATVSVMGLSWVGVNDSPYVLLLAFEYFALFTGFVYLITH